VLDGAGFDEPATQQAAQGLDKWGARRPTLVVLDAEEVGALKSFRNLSGVSVMQSSEVGVADVIGHQSLVISQTALEQLTQRASEGKDG
jgi:large subunit ribosomal protein L4